ncbi:MAG: hypothetical protein LUE64_02360, partial [Candidatus Gastranaerophilales bacterium]|nr:hypothetical protein [Candidatus Gastranaerophilales bacterium]
AMTIPSVITNINEHQFKSALKKNFSVFQNAFNLIASLDNDDFRTWNYSHSLSFTTEVAEKLFKYLSVQKICGHDEGCFPFPSYLINNSVFLSTPNQPEMYYFILNDGTMVQLDCYTNSNAQYLLGFNKDSLLAIDDTNLSVTVDLNGEKKPNTLGKDIYVFLLTDKGLLPAGTDNESANCSTTGRDCAYKVLSGK